MRIILWFFSLPHIFIGSIIELFFFGNILNDVEKCRDIAELKREDVPQVFIDALIACEDHRSLFHPGIDPISIVRALLIFIRHRKIQGASTIEQQFIRVVLERYEFTITRKFREQIIAVLLVSKVEKRKIALSYLSIAYYGSGLVGIDAIKLKFPADLNSVSFNSALRMIAQLKYPEPLSSDKKWQRKIDNRVTEVLMRIRKKRAIKLAFFKNRQF